MINFDAPDDRESYVHRIGRTGRAGRTGIGITFVEAEQARDVGRIAADLRLHGEFERAGLAPAPRPHTTGGGAAGAAAPRGGRSRAAASSYPPAFSAHVVGDLLDLLVAQLALERRHPAAAVGDLRLDEVRARTQLVEVRADLAGRAGRGERVAVAAVVGEQLLRAAAAAGRGLLLRRRNRRAATEQRQQAHKALHATMYPCDPTFVEGRSKALVTSTGLVYTSRRVMNRASPCLVAASSRSPRCSCSSRATGLVEPGLALSMAPALLLLALLTGGFRPGEALIERLRARFDSPRPPRASSAPRPRLALVVRPTGRLLASALAMRPPPSPLAVTS